MKKTEKHIPYTLKVLELFGGIGAPRKALENLLGKNKVKFVDYVDILNWATFAYSKLYENEYQPQSIKEWNLDIDLVFHGSPCQDFSIAGKGLGGNLNSNTRSSLLWETIDIIKNRLTKLPKVIIWENVKGVLNKNHIQTYNEYKEELEKLGYINKEKLLIATDFGIPQRRQRIFCISILNTAKEFLHFDFENLEKKPLIPLKEFLEKNVSERYYIKQKSMIKAIERKKIIINDNIVQTITTKQMRWNNAGVIKIPLSTFNQENYIFEPSLSTLPTITSSGANSRLKIAIPLNINKEDYRYTYYECKLDNEKKLLPVFIIDKKPYHLRVITPKEAWLLMGFTEEDYNKIKDLPETAKYLLAGNSIVVQVLEAIFKELLKGEK